VMLKSSKTITASQRLDGLAGSNFILCLLLTTPWRPANPGSSRLLDKGSCHFRGCAAFFHGGLCAREFDQVAPLQKIAQYELLFVLQLGRAAQRFQELRSRLLRGRYVIAQFDIFPQDVRKVGVEMFYIPVRKLRRQDDTLQLANRPIARRQSRIA